MVIDFHTHVFPDKIAASTIAGLEERAGIKAAVNGTVPGILASMEESGVTESVILPVVTSPRQFDSVNRFAQEINERYEGRLLSFGGIHPDCEDFREKLRQLKSMGFKGIKLHPDYQGVSFDDIRYKRIVGCAAELDMIITVHAGIDIGFPEMVRCTPSMALEVLKETEADKVVLAHLGGWKMWDEVEALLVGKKVILDMAFIEDYMEREQFCRIVEMHGADRIVFATDSPWTGQKRAISWLRECSLPEETEEMILWKNARRLLESV